MKFAFIYAMPGLQSSSIQENVTEKAHFYCVSVDMNHRETAADIARELVEKNGVQMIELSGGLASAEIIALVKEETENRVPVGAVFYGPESRKPLIELMGI
ncbi:MULTISPECIES: DUF6506 family protein [unclassified Endozoicomonas]|uniref:DUF6506 family protein n=1 Tax=unclassified Endozoicomonas TaxID=2644528 RepID=UPI003BB5D229